MKRAAMIHCANIDLQRYKVLKRRDQLPFVDEYMEDGMLGGNAYTLDHAFCLRLMADIMGGEGEAPYKHQGLPPSYAQNVISNAQRFWNLNEAPMEQTQGPDVWLGVLISEEQNEDETLRFSDWFCGSLADLGSWVTQKNTHEGTKLRPVRIFITNATLAADAVKERAYDLGLPEALEYPQRKR